MNETLIGAFIGALATLIIGFLDNMINKHTAFSDVITKQRIKTINEMRNLVANIYACIINLN